MFTRVRHARRVLKAWKNRKKNHELAVAGKTTSAYLTPGERQRLFRNRRR